MKIEMIDTNGNLVNENTLLTDEQVHALAVALYPELIEYVKAKRSKGIVEAKEREDA